MKYINETIGNRTRDLPACSHRVRTYVHGNILAPIDTNFMSVEVVLIICSCLNDQ